MNGKDSKGMEQLPCDVSLKRTLQPKHKRRQFFTQFGVDLHNSSPKDVVAADYRTLNS